MDPSQPGPSRKSDQELIIEYGIEDCWVVLEREPLYKPKKVFQVHYMFGFLQEIASSVYESPYYMFGHRPTVNLDELYDTYITSQFSTMTRSKFKSLMTLIFTTWDNYYRQRRARLIKARIDQLNAQQEALRAERRKIKITYRGMTCIFRGEHTKELVKSALSRGRKAQVLLKRVDDPPGATVATTSNSEQSAAGDVVPSQSPAGVVVPALTSQPPVGVVVPVVPSQSPVGVVVPALTSQPPVGVVVPALTSQPPAGVVVPSQSPAGVDVPVVTSQSTSDDVVMENPPNTANDNQSGGV